MTLAGIERGSREKLAKVLRATQGTITPKNAAAALNEAQLITSKLLARWATQGWLQRVRRGLYIPVPLESERSDNVPEDSWLIAQSAFAPCFISGLSAIEHWSLTEQVFRSVSLATTRKPRQRLQSIGGTEFAIHTVSEDQFFGLKTVWRGPTKVKVSDPSRAVIDLLANPSLGAGIRFTTDVLETYLKSEHCNFNLLLDYAEKMGNGACFKRLGYLLQKVAPHQTEVINQCATKMTAGYAKLDPSLPSDRLATAWGLWVPKGW